ncbi:testis-specific serine/threonine-protein kinase 6 [Gastrophryne carolinensis]
MTDINLLLKDLGYHVLCTIGEGAYSKVKMATSVKHNGNVAIKVLDRKRAPAEYTTKLLPRELEILKTVHHPNIIASYSFIDVSNGLYFIVMELCSMDLLKYIQNEGSLKEEMAKCFFQQIISGLSYLHRIDVVHRDLKCENILMMEAHKLKITDFSFGKLLDSADPCTTYCGSAAYASPEVVKGIPYDPKKSDIWSLGVILYVMVTGTMPFDYTNITALPELQKKGVEFEEEKALDENCKSLICSLLAYSPTNRPDICIVKDHSWLRH